MSVSLHGIPGHIGRSALVNREFGKGTGRSIREKGRGCLRLGAWGVIIWCIANAATAAATQFSFDAEQSTANVVLRKIAQQSDTQILFSLEKTKSINANGVRGRYSLGEALEIALKDTGLKAEFLDSGAIAVSVAADENLPRGETDVRNGIWSRIMRAFLALPVAASAQSGAVDPASLEPVVVTGTLIKRNQESSQLVTNVGIDEIHQRGATNAIEILSAVSQNQTIATSNDGARVGSLTNLANLRTLGPENTLVLVNGKRIVNNPIFDNGVDLNTVPTALLDRVDVLSDGASSIYGSDAVAGVINFRTKEEYQGLEYKMYARAPQESGGDVRNASLAGGLGSLKDDHWNFTFGATWRDLKAISSADRAFSKTSLIPDRGVDNILSQPFPANLSQTGTIANANPYPCTPPELVPRRGGCGLDSDAAGLIDIQNPETQKSAFARAATLLGEQRLAVEYLWAESSVTSALTGSTVFGYTMPNTSPYFPGNGLVPAVPGLDPTRSITVSTRFTPGGRRTTENLSTTDRLLVQLDGTALGGDYELWALRSTSIAKLKSLDGALLISGIEDGLAGTNGAPFINPFGEQSTEAAQYLESIKVKTDLARGDGKLTMAGVTYSRPIFDLPAGNVTAALAYEYGKEEMDFGIYPINNLLEGAVVGTSVQASGHRERNSVTGEFLVPILDGLEADASIRLDDYSDFGSTVNPKIMLSYDVNDSVNLHGSYNEGFRAPPLPKLLAPQTLGLVSGLRSDPVLCPGGVVDVAAGGIALRDCAIVYNSLTGGNPDLQPQTSSAFTLGTSIRLRNLPLGTAAFSLDYWNYELKSAIGVLSPDAIFANPDQFSSYLVRCSGADPFFRDQSISCTFPGGATGDPIAYVALNNANVGTTKTAGIDLTANWFAETSFGSLAIGYRATYVTQYDFQRLPGESFLSRQGKYQDGYPVIGYSHFLTFGWEKGQWSANLQNRYKDGYSDCNAACFVPVEQFNRVDPYSLWNVATTYKISDAIAVTLHIENMFDTDPSFTNSFNGNCSGCDMRFSDPTGRAFGVTFTGRLGMGSTR